ncbi:MULTISPECIES: hypothetical protein [Mycobacterium]|jgi:hypothetical protein|uniref:Uncharacterized protein n=4 Tax=Mycobacterium TaxID=1763 RepID=D5P536_9MYCO|nr:MULTISPECIES: hypothetical protein [Mycobacterium]AGZ54687.1 hypothetical protein MKAN_29810 [Mycobacterium kansasii ATCC 12478]ARG72288.1 hypothetical protein B1T47_28765 [Mycobacterium kansasii]ARV85506.1 hypothetical protein BWK49_29220 [Mycobacterium intracellulare subsp. chimaera]ASL12418.1 hypothetical protein MYCODSM44623_05745 [Mycobacterium intracellulare subsp. chimaera]ASL24205.1 hypothetical protein MYCOZU1_05844 [Mycobacterium intracellulare subsp. chimaera]
MGNKAVSKQARRAAREAATAAQDEVIRRTKANVEDLATFFDARDRAEAVDAWLAERQQALAQQAAQRRANQRVKAGAALRAMRDRGETLREIGRMAGLSEKAVRDLIRETESSEQAAEPVAGAVTPAPAVTPERVGGKGDDAQSPPADALTAEPIPAHA